MKFKAEITFVVEIEAEDADEASDILWEWNPLHPEEDSETVDVIWVDRKRVEPDNIEFEEIK